MAHWPSRGRSLADVSGGNQTSPKNLGFEAPSGGFLTLVPDKARVGGGEPRSLFRRPIEARRNFSGRLRVVVEPQGDFVVGNGNTDVGSKTPTRKPDRPLVDRVARRIEAQNPPKDGPICGAMAQQCGDLGRGNQSAPQKFVHLVGCRDPKARPEPPRRPRPAPQKS
jgi:hypothetical protein